MRLEADSEKKTKEIGEWLAGFLGGGEVIELTGDLGSGKTTFVKGLALGLGITEDVQSPSFTISRIYDSPGGIRLAHYDFYRLEDPGLMTSDLEENVRDQRVVTIVEWGKPSLRHVLPADRLVIRFVPTSTTVRQLEFEAGGPRSRTLLEKLL